MLKSNDALFSHILSPFSAWIPTYPSLLHLVFLIYATDYNEKMSLCTVTSRNFPPLQYFHLLTKYLVDSLFACGILYSLGLTCMYKSSQ